MLQSTRLKNHVLNIGIDKSVSNKTLYEHKFLENIKKSYKTSGKCDDQEHFIDILEAAMTSNPEGFTNDSPISTMTSTPVKKTSAGKSLCLFTKILYVKKKTATRQIGAAKSKGNAIKYLTTAWAFKKRGKEIRKLTNR